jgi:hypothetical protein
MMRGLPLFAIALLCASCASSARPPGAPAPTGARSPATTNPSLIASTKDWIGIYASTSEIGGFSGTTLALSEDSRDALCYRMRFYSDVISVNQIQQDELYGSCLTDRNVLYLPKADGFIHDGKPTLLASIERYALMEVNGHKVLMRDDALQAFLKENRLYDYGILVKVSDQADFAADLKKVEHPSIKMLYANPAHPWSDPFVSGPNGR